MPSPPSLHPDFHALVRWETGTVAPPVDLGKARLKELRALGHKVERFLSARGACWKHPVSAVGEALSIWTRIAGPAPGELAGEGLFACVVCLEDGGFHLPQPVVGSDLTSRLAALWQRTDPGAPRALPPFLSVSDHANAPLWLALLRLRPLRTLWERELRRATLESLLDVLPDAWVLDPTPLPPGAVIPRLELASWNDLPRLHGSGRRFVIASPLTMDHGLPLGAAAPRKHWDDAILMGLETSQTLPRIVVEESAASDMSLVWVVAFYEKKGGRVDGIGALALTADAAGGLVPGRITPV